jgi:NodT family efflux transporter outer membrane factor (OMF) lipoprotein
MFGMRKITKVLVVVLMPAFLGGCAVGPDFKSPAAPQVKDYTAKSLPRETDSSQVFAGGAQSLIFGEDVPADWWKIFQSEKLNVLLAETFAANPNLEQAKAALRQAQENVNSAVGSVVYPSVDVGLSSTRMKTSSASAGISPVSNSVYSLHTSSVSVSYLLDFFGSGRRGLEALRSRVDYQRFQLEAVRLTLTSNVILSVVREAFLRAQLNAYKNIIASQEKQKEMLRLQLQAGAVSLSDVLAQQASLEQNRAVLPVLEKEISQNRYRLAILSGRLPSQEDQFPVFNLNDLVLPQELPVSLPSSLVRQRPDIRAAESLMHAACAQVGVATANMFPRIGLNGSYGTQANAVGDIFDTKSSVWNAGVGLLQPVFHGGSLKAGRRAAAAVYDQAAAGYRQTVLTAFGDVAGVLRALDADAASLKSCVAAESAARDSFELKKKQFAAGAVSYSSVLDSDRQYQQVLINRITAQIARFSDTVALFAALGGGWWNNKKNNID